MSGHPRRLAGSLPACPGSASSRVIGAFMMSLCLRMRVPDTLDAKEVIKLFTPLSQRDRVMVLLDATIRLRESGLIGLKIAIGPQRTSISVSSATA